MPGGRPTVYKPEHTEIARRFAVSRRTIDSWIAAIPDFAEAVREGRAVADLAVISALFARATAIERTRTKMFCHRGQPVTARYTEHLPPDVSACMFWLRNRRPNEWRENRPLVNKAANRRDLQALPAQRGGFLRNMVRRNSIEGPAAIGTSLAGIAQTPRSTPRR